MDGISSHANRKRHKCCHHQIAENPYSATGIGRGSSRSTLPERRGHLVVITTNAIRPSKGACMTGELRLGTVAGSIRRRYRLSMSRLHR